jgi:CheY-like chemotaxis protein
MPLKGRALVVDDQVVWLELFEELLHELGLEVMTAGNYEEAVRLLDGQYFHLAIVDVRLKDDDPNNTQGMDILAHINELGLGDVVAKIVITGYGTRDWARDSFKKYSVHDFIPKQGPEGRGFDGKDFIQSVESAFIEKLKINFGLDMEFVHSLSLDELASQIRLDGNRHEPPETLRWELDDLLRKLFPDADSLVVSSLSKGRSKTNVIKVEPFYAGRGQSGPFIVKYGQVDDIEREADNFGKYVKKFMTGRRHTDLDCKARTRLLGGIIYSLIGAPFEKVRGFSEFYFRSSATQVCLVLDDLFNQNCSLWYQNRQPLRKQNLANLYWQALNATPDKVTACFEHRYPNFVGRPRITFRELDGEFVNPIYHPFVKDKPIYLPVHNAITHGDLNGDNIFVDQDNYTWMIDFSRTGDGHILRDFIELESVIKFQLLDNETLTALYEFEKAILAPTRFDEKLILPERTITEEMAKAFSIVEHLRALAGKVVQPRQDMEEYYAGLFYHTLNLIRYYHLLKASNRKSYILLSSSLLCDRLETLATMRSGGI